MEKKSVKEIVSMILKAVALAMGIAVVVLSCMNKLEAQTGIVLLGIGLTCTAISRLEK